MSGILNTRAEEEDLDKYSWEAVKHWRGLDCQACPLSLFHRSPMLYAQPRSYSNSKNYESVFYQTTYYYLTLNANLHHNHLLLCYSY